MILLFATLLLNIPVDHYSGMRCHPDQWVAKTGDWLTMKCQNSLGEYTYWKKIYNDFELKDVHTMHALDCGTVPTPTVIEQKEVKNEPK